MTGEQIKDSLKNHSQNFSENSTQEKEQIIIDGCNVSECLFYQSNFEEDYDVKIKHFCSNWHNSCESANNSNCYYKQLARKTQECEKYEQALDEIYLIIDEIKEQYDIWEISELEQIQDIINKAKGEGICQ